MEPGTSEHKIVFTGGITLLILLSLFGNTLVCFAVYYSRNLRARVNYLIVSLAISDILIAIIAMPLWMTFEINYYLHVSDEAAIRLNRVMIFVDVLGGIASIANLVAISFERLWSVCSPLNHRKHLTNWVLFFIITGVWAYAIIIASTTIAFLDTWEYVVLYTSTLGFFFPLFLIITAYSTIFVIVNRSPRTVVSSEDNFKINITICIIIGLFTICWAPHFIFSVLHIHCHSCYDHLVENLWYRSLSQWLHYANSCVNPIVYGIANAQYKEAFKVVFKKICATCLYKNEGSEPISRMPALLYPHSTQERSTICSDKLRVELEPEKKEGHEANGCNPDASMYPPGDYRALPSFHSPRSRRWNSLASTTTETTFLSASVMESTIAEDENTSLQTALLTPDSLQRKEYLPSFGNL